jgi:DNA-binding CsgD family transcriptional regulator
MPEYLNATAALVLLGLNNVQIARSLGVSSLVAKNYVERLRAELGCTSKLEIAVTLLGARQ